jgi:hypothetical protein
LIRRHSNTFLLQLSDLWDLNRSRPSVDLLSASWTLLHRTWRLHALALQIRQHVRPRITVDNGDPLRGSNPRLGWLLTRLLKQQSVLMWHVSSRKQLKQD